MNKESYLLPKVVRYYSELSDLGCFRYEEDLIRRYISPNSSILDVGCGVGRITRGIKGFCSVTGLDFSLKMIEKAREKDAESTYLVGDVREMPFTDNQFDGVVFAFNGLMLLKGLESRVIAVREIHRVLRVGGVFFFTTAFLDNKMTKDYWRQKIKTFGKTIGEFSAVELLTLGDEALNDDGVNFDIHVPFLKEVRDLLTGCGLEIVFEGRRLDYFEEEVVEEKLDDNYLWIARKYHV